MTISNRKGRLLNLIRSTYIAWTFIIASSLGWNLYSVDNINNQDFLRLIQPMVTQAVCLKCHQHQGSKVDDVQDAIGVSVPMAPFHALVKTHSQQLLLGHILLLLIGLTGI